MEKYVDLITNGLDLLSFLLLTPEILRITRPITTWVVYLATAVGVVMIGFIVPTLLLIAIYATEYAIGRTYRPDEEMDKSDYFVMALWPITWLSTLFFLGRLVVHVDSWVDRTSRHFLALGIVLFFLSRLIAFYGSAVKAGFL
jgi:hypothetical protein